MDAPLCFCRVRRDAQPDDTEQDTYKTQKSKTELPTKRGKTQTETNGSGFEEPVRVGASCAVADQGRASGCGL